MILEELSSKYVPIRPGPISLYFRPNYYLKTSTKFFALHIKFFLKCCYINNSMLRIEPVIVKKHGPKFLEPPTMAT